MASLKYPGVWSNVGMMIDAIKGYESASQLNV